MKPLVFGIHLKVRDFEASLNFYTKFGFIPTFAYGPKDFCTQFTGISTAAEKYRGITFAIGNALLELGEDHIAIKPEVFQERITSSKVSAMVDVSSLLEVRKICELNDFEITKPETSYPWGMRELVIRDPDGFILVFREHTHG
jgi:catechol 2,3-dioxygenase-like lactoylglutathione lyase family enzyme